MVFESNQKVHSQPDEGADVLSLRDVVHIIRSRIWLILLVVCSVTGITVGYTLMQTPMYKSSIVVLVGQRQLTDASSGNLAANVEGVQRLTKTLTEAVARRPTAEAVVKQLDLGI